jgi:teichuronic acid exporter
VLVLLTSKWEGCILYLQLLCVVGALYPLQVINLSVLTAQGHSDLFLRLEIIKKCLIVSVVAITWRWGITAMIFGQIGLAWVGLCLNAHFTGRLLRYGFWKQIADMLPYAVAAGVMFIAVYSFQLWDWGSNLSLLIAQCIFGAVLYVAICRLFALEAFMELWRRFVGGTGFDAKNLKPERL